MATTVEQEIRRRAIQDCIDHIRRNATQVDKWNGDPNGVLWNEANEIELELLNDPA